MGWLSHHHRGLNHHSHGWVAWPSRLGMRLSSTCPQTFQLGHVLMAQQPPSPPLRWLHLFLGGPPPLPLLPPGASKPALCPSWLGAATPPVWRAPYPGPSSWWPALARHLVTWTTHPNSSCHQLSCQWCQRLFRHQFFNGGCLPMSASSPTSSTSSSTWLLHRHPLLLHLCHIPAWS